VSDCVYYILVHNKKTKKRTENIKKILHSTRYVFTYTAFSYFLSTKYPKCWVAKARSKSFCSEKHHFILISGVFRSCKDFSKVLPITFNYCPKRVPAATLLIFLSFSSNTTTKKTNEENSRRKNYSMNK
jgi:hypothetical protein